MKKFSLSVDGRYKVVTKLLLSNLVYRSNAKFKSKLQDYCKGTEIKTVWYW